MKLGRDRDGTGAPPTGPTGPVARTRAQLAEAQLAVRMAPTAMAAAAVALIVAGLALGLALALLMEARR